MPSDSDNEDEDAEEQVANPSLALLFLRIAKSETAHTVTTRDWS